MVWTLLDGGDHEGKDWIITENATAAGFHYNVGTFRIVSGVTLFTPHMEPRDSYYNTNLEKYKLSIMASDVDISGTISGAGRGFLGGGDYQYGNPWGGPFSGFSLSTSNGMGPGAGHSGGSGRGGGGGGYGGQGSNGYHVDGEGNFRGGFPYGTDYQMDIHLGSGGGRGNSSGYGGCGGGAVAIFSGNLNISGVIDMSASAPIVGTNGWNGGGSGGAITLFCNRGYISGIVRANGSNGTYRGGGGGGGRIKIRWCNFIEITGSIVATGGTGHYRSGGDGTQYNDSFGWAYLIAPFAHTMTLDSDLPMVVTSLTYYSLQLTNDARYRLDVWDSPSKQVLKGRGATTFRTSAPIQTERTWNLDNPMRILPKESVYVEIYPLVTTSHMQFAYIMPSDTLKGSIYYMGVPLPFFEPYVKINGYGHMTNPTLYNIAAKNIRQDIANSMLIGESRRIGIDGMGHVQYRDDFYTAKYLSDAFDYTGVFHDAPVNQIHIPNGGHITYKLDAKYPIQGNPVMSSRIINISRSAAIEIALDNEGAPDVWYPIDMPINSHNNEDYQLVSSGAVEYDGETVVWVRISCDAMSSANIAHIEFNIDIRTADAQTPPILTGGANTFRLTQDIQSAPAGTITLEYEHRRIGW